jgi:hypothetical protein
MLTIYAPFNNQQSKAWEVFNGIKKSWPDSHQILDNIKMTQPVSNSMFWGLVNNNLKLIKKLESRKHGFWFTDTPYFGRFDNKNLKPDNHYWRICKNKIHATFLKDCKADRFEKFGIKIKAPTLKGSHILVCPSSTGIHNYLDRPNWTNETIDHLKRVTDRPIRLRHKPRGRGTSGPSEATVPLSEDLKDAWACVTSCSISAVEAVCMGVPVFCDKKSFAEPMGNLHLEDIEDPYYAGPEPWLYSLAYQQFTPEEIENGHAIEILIDKGFL